MSKACLVVCVSFVIAIGLAALVAWVIMLLWNWLTPWPLTFWQCWGALILLSLIKSWLFPPKGKTNNE